jgi:hypothetical protein
MMAEQMRGLAHLVAMPEETRVDIAHLHFALKTLT